MQQVMLVIEKNISNSEFSVEELSAEVNMSRVALYKKVLTLTGKTPVEFIKSIRLNRAAQLLEKSQLTISEIAYEVGFTNPKYFTKTFKSAYGILPSAYANKHHGEEEHELP
ncbi:HTH-type transcriptional regulator ChbR [compost metagenome]